MNVEITPTLDVAGGLPQQSFPVDTTRLADGRHRLVASITTAAGTHELAAASLDVDNSSTAAPRRPVRRIRHPACSPGPTAPPCTAPWRRAEAIVVATAEDPATIHHVLFFVDAVLVGESWSAPHTVRLGDIAGLAPGQHILRASVILTDGSLWAVNANFTVAA